MCSLLGFFVGFELGLGLGFELGLGLGSGGEGEGPARRTCDARHEATALAIMRSCMMAW